MNLCIISFQAILLAVLVVHYQFINEVEADASFSVGNWFTSIEKKVDIQLPNDELEYENNASEVSYENGMMNGVLRDIRQKADDLIALPRRLIQKATGTSTNNKPNKEDVDISELADVLNVTPFDASAVSSEVKNKTESETQQEVVTENQEAPKKKRRTKRHKKKGRSKHENNQHEQRTNAIAEKDAAEFGNSFKIKDHKKRLTRRKFKKVTVKDGNNSESDEMNRRKPVDIIVHIKMND